MDNIKCGKYIKTNKSSASGLFFRSPRSETLPTELFPRSPPPPRMSTVLRLFHQVQHLPSELRAAHEGVPFSGPLFSTDVEM